MSVAFNNPFSPLFGGRPEFFFGRQRILSSFERAFSAHGSDYRALFITGTRGFGKTALLEQLSMRAGANKWDVIDVNAENALQSLFRQLCRFEEVSTTTDPKVEVKVLGSGGSLGGRSTQKTNRYTVDDLDILLIEACRKARHGIFVSIDEIQKVPLEDVSQISGAFQMASRKGLEVMLAVAGLPFAHPAIAQQDGCTYMRRAVHEELGLFSPAEVQEAFESAFAQVKGLLLDDGQISRLVASSSGHPYMMQLLGFNVVDLACERAASSRYRITDNDIEDAFQYALSAYEQRALKPILEALGTSEVRYLQAMASCLDDGLIASTADIAKAIGKPANKLTYSREQLIRNGIIISPGRGKVRFGIPYLRQYVQKGNAQSENARLIEEWGV